MKLRRRQRGIGMLAMMALAVIVGGGFLFGLKLFPIYTESFTIDKALKSTVEQGDVGEMTKRQIQRSFMKRLEIDDVRRINDGNFKEYVKITKKGKKVTIEINYEAIAPLFQNLSLLATFEKKAAN